MKPTAVFMISHSLAVAVEAALAALDTSWFLDLAQVPVLDRRDDQMTLSNLMGVSVVLGELIGIGRSRQDTAATVSEINEVRRQAAEEEMSSHGAPPRLEMGTTYDRLYRAAFAESRHRHCRDELAAMQARTSDRSALETVGVVALLKIPCPAPMTDIRLRAVVGELGYRASSIRHAELYHLIETDSDGLYRVTPELSTIIPWTPPTS